MPDYNSIINNLNRKLMLKLNKIRVIPDEGDKEQSIEEFMGGYVGGMGFSQHYGGLSYTQGTDPRDAKTFDHTYKTHTPATFRKDHQAKGGKPKFKKKDEDEDKKHFVDLSGESGEEDYEEDMKMSEIEALPAAPPPEGPEADPTATEDTGAADEAGGDFAPEGGDPGMGAGGDVTDPGLGDPMAGMPGQEEPKDPNDLGRTYEMKKIYSRLVSMNQYLADEQDRRIMKTKQSIAKAIDLFAVIGANPESYKERIDEIIVGYYKFLEAAYKRVRSFYKLEAQRVGGLPFEKNEEQKDDTPTEVTI